jgi:hypothetical protein
MASMHNSQRLGRTETTGEWLLAFEIKELEEQELVIRKLPLVVKNNESRFIKLFSLADMANDVIVFDGDVVNWMYGGLAVEQEYKRRRIFYTRGSPRKLQAPLPRTQYTS